ncbi:MAG: transposase, partial [Candidatus Ornithomonoglobus sp.]
EERLLEERSALSYARRQGEAKGRAEGRAEGEAKGRAEGRAEGRADMIAALRELGIDEATLQKAAERIN